MKKFVALVLSFIMVFSLIPSIVLAEDDLCPGENCAFYTEFTDPSWSVPIHGDFDVTGQKMHKVAGVNGDSVKMFEYDSTGNRTEHIIESIDVDDGPVENSSIIKIYYAPNKVEFYAKYDLRMIYIGSGDADQPTQILQYEGACETWINDKVGDKADLWIYIDNVYNTLNSNSGNYGNEFEAFPPITMSHIGSSTPAVACTKARLDGNGRPRITYIGSGTTVNWQISGSDIAQFFINCFSETPLGAITQQIVWMAVGYAIAERDEEPIYRVYYVDYYLFIQKLKSLPPLEFDNDFSGIGIDYFSLGPVGYSGWGGHVECGDFLRGAPGDNSVRGWTCIDLPDLDDGINHNTDQGTKDAYLKQQVEQRHPHTFPGEYNALCSMICPDCGFGRRDWPNNGHPTCWMHAKDQYEQWKHVKIDVECDIPILDWNDSYSFSTTRLDCNCTDTGRFAADPNHIYTSCADSICDCGFERVLPGIPNSDGHVYDGCEDIDCNSIGCTHVRGGFNHIMSVPYWYNAESPTDNLCQEFENYCTREGCDFTLVSMTRGHIFTDCENPVCSRAGCGYVGTPLVHSMSVPYWYNVESPTDNVCQKYENYCTRENCEYTLVSMTRGHSYADCKADACDRSGCTYNRGTVPGDQSDAYGHVYDDCDDTICNRCDFERDPAAHSMSVPYWYNVESPTADVCQKYENYCMREGCDYTLVSMTRGHSYADCQIGACDRSGCTYNRGTAAGTVQDGGHVYSDTCTATTCNRDTCGFERTAPGHSMSVPYWYNVASPTSSLCQKYENYCTKEGCSYTLVSNTRGHSYADCADRSCGRTGCGYTRGAVSGYLQSGHVYSNYCTATNCKRCGYDRTAPGHSYNVPYWYNVKSASVCREYRNYCTRTACSNYIVVQRDTTHSYTYKWVNVGKASTCRKYVGTCSSCGYSYVSSYDYTHNLVYITSGIYRCTSCTYTGPYV